MAGGVAISFSNIIYFLPEYMIATILALLMFVLIDRVRKPKIIPVLQRDSIIFSWMELCGTLASPLPSNEGKYKVPFSLEILPTSISKGLASLVKDHLERVSGTISPKLIRTHNSPVVYQYPRMRLPFRELFDDDTAFFIYRIAISVTIWSGAFLLITPFQYLHFFLPNFGTSIDIIIDVIIGVSIFESIVTAIATHTGRDYTWILITEFLVVLLASISLYLPAMLWFRAEAISLQIVTYLVLILLISIITVLAFFIGKKRYTFILSFAFAIISYSLFIFTTAINIAGYIIPRI